MTIIYTIIRIIVVFLKSLIQEKKRILFNEGSGDHEDDDNSEKHQQHEVEKSKHYEQLGRVFIQRSRKLSLTSRFTSRRKSLQLSSSGSTESYSSKQHRQQHQQ